MKCKPYSESTVEIRTQLKTVKITSNIFAVQAINSKILRLLLKASSPTVFSSVSSICLSSIFLAHILSESQGSFERFSSLFSVTKHLSCSHRYLERWLNGRISKRICCFKPVAQLSQ